MRGASDPPGPPVLASLYWVRQIKVGSKWEGLKNFLTALFFESLFSAASCKKKDSKNVAAKNFFVPSYFVMALVEIWKSKCASKQISIYSLWIVSSKFYSGTICWPFNLHNSKKGHRQSPCNVTHCKNVNMLEFLERQNLLKITFMIHKAKITPIFKIMLEKDF